MRVVSVNVSAARRVDWRGKPVSTGIFKTPVEAPVRVGIEGLAGDEQADRAVHGGPAKAVYLYPSEHYPFWRSEYPDVALPWGMFGENVTTEGLLETDVHVGDTLRVGTTILAVTKPRFPCYKLGIKFGRPDVVDRFLESERSGFYASVLEPGQVAAGDPIERLRRAPESPTVAEVLRANAARDAG